VVLNLLSYPITEAGFEGALATLRSDLVGRAIHMLPGPRQPLLITE
jgi:hypothetical protein